MVATIYSQKTETCEAPSKWDLKYHSGLESPGASGSFPLDCIREDLICAVVVASGLSSHPHIPTRNPGSRSNAAELMKASGSCSVSPLPVPGLVVRRADSRELQCLLCVRGRLPGGWRRKCLLLAPPARCGPPSLL